ncbi:MAG: lipid-A-disaccharide synthase [Sediminibacterium sp.]
MPTRYYIIAGEASGDLHGSNLIRAIKVQEPDAIIRCWGGELMQAAGGTLVKHYRDLAFMGFWEVVKNLPTILQNLNFCKKDITAFRPDVLVCIDYPGFNLRIAEWAHEQNYKVAYYISPQVWAWKEKRVIKMKKIIDEMICILPFEKEYFAQKWNWQVHYVGHPLLEVVEIIQEVKAAEKIIWYKNLHDATPPQQPIIALLPGSRQQEIKKVLPAMLEATRNFPEHDFAIAMAPGIDSGFYQHMLEPYPQVFQVHNQTHALLLQSAAAIVTSGTATLETALIGIPEVVVYKGSPISFFIAKQLIHIPFIALANLIMNKKIVTELIQEDVTPQKIGIELRKILRDADVIRQIKSDYQELKEKLDTGGKASEKAASIVINLSKQTIASALA